MNSESLPAGAVTLVDAEAADLDWILAVEAAARDNGFVIGDEAVSHQAQMRSPSALYLLVKQGEERIGYVILKNVSGARPVIELKRIVIDRTGKGLGTAAMRAVLDLAFGEMSAHRVWLDVLDDNARAIRLYRKLGFVEEGRLREAARRGDTWRDLMIFGLLDREYAPA